jgi:hypothetical protein
MPSYLLLRWESHRPFCQGWPVTTILIPGSHIPWDERCVLPHPTIGWHVLYIFSLAGLEWWVISISVSQSHPFKYLELQAWGTSAQLSYWIFKEKIILII